MKEVEQHESPIVALAAFAKSIGRTPVTVWRWQKLGWLGKSVNIAGKPYLTRESIRLFMERAAAGNFAKAPHVPQKTKASPPIPPVTQPVRADKAARQFNRMRAAAGIPAPADSEDVALGRSVLPLGDR